jgi:hypothetical protein
MVHENQGEPKVWRVYVRKNRKQGKKDEGGNVERLGLGMLVEFCYMG